jgi:hypothetical protein
MAFAITIDTTATVAAIRAQGRNPGAVNLVVGRSVQNALRLHFRAKDAAEPNRLGGERTHFWLQVARSITQRSTPNSVEVAITDPRAAQKFYGGTIKAKRAWKNGEGPFLTIPIDPLAHGRRVSVLARQMGWKIFRRGMCLAANTGGGIRNLYALKTQLTQKATPGTLPDASVLQSAVARALRQLTSVPPPTA